MRVQLQEGSVNTYGAGSIRQSTPITVRQLNRLLDACYLAVKASQVAWYPISSGLQLLGNAVVSISQKLQGYPPGGTGSGLIRSMESESWRIGKRDMRLDVDNLEGRNLQSHK
jgi:hypothetical protein